MSLRFKGNILPKGVLSAEIKKYWGIEQKVLASDGKAEEIFGQWGSISQDGATAVISARNEISTNVATGKLYVFTRSGNTWAEQQILTLPQTPEPGGDRYGYSVSISDDGNTIIAGSRFEGSSSQGAAYVFTRSGGTWTQQQKLVASDAQTNNNFGVGVSMSGDGNVAVVGAFGNNSFRGAAYVFTRSGGTWTQQQKLVASDAQTNDYLGIVVSTNFDGSTIVANARQEDTGGTDAGAAYVFTRSGGTWTQQQKLQASDKQANDLFGLEVVLSSDGNTLAISNGPSSRPKSTYVFKRSGGTWTEQQKLALSAPQENGSFGSSIGISGDGKKVIVRGTPRSGTFQCAYIFTETGGAWVEQQTLTASDVSQVAGTGYGRTVSMNTDGSVVLVTARNVDTNGFQAGAAYFYMPE